MNITFHEQMKEDSASIYEVVADHMLSLDQGETITNEQLCIVAGYDPGETMESAMLTSVIGNKIRTGVDRCFSERGMALGFAKQINVNKRLGEHHLLAGSDYYMDQALHLTARMLMIVSSWTKKSNQIYIENKKELDRGQKYTFRKILGMADEAATMMDSLASPEIPKIIARDKSFQPLEDLIKMLGETVAEMED